MQVNKYILNFSEKNRTYISMIEIFGINGFPIQTNGDVISVAGGLFGRVFTL